jgi:predicted DNA binding CopG/RHH family protein
MSKRQSITLRLPIDLLEKLKLVAQLKGMAYQPMMREALEAAADQGVLKILREEAEASP